MLPIFPLDQELLLWINQHHSAFLDAFMFMISRAWAWLPVVGAFIFWLFYKKPWQESLLILLIILIGIGLGDNLSSTWAKPFFARLRPSHTEGLKDLLHYSFDYQGGSYGFFSSHATNFFALGIFLIQIIRDKRFSFIMLLLVSLVAYSRMYLGVHFPSDIIVGVLCGSLIGLAMAKSYQWLKGKIHSLNYPRRQSNLDQGLGYFLIALYLFLPILSCYSAQLSQIIKELN